MTQRRSKHQHSELVGNADPNNEKPVPYEADLCYRCGMEPCGCVRRAVTTGVGTGSTQR